MPPGAHARVPRSSPLALSRMPTVRPAQELIDSAFHRAAKITVWLRDPFERFRATETARVRSVQNSLSATLETYVRRFPSFEALPPFYVDLVGLLTDLDRMKQSLGAVDWARNRVNEIGDEAAAAIKASRREDLIHEAKSRAYGRIASILKQIDRNLRYLDEARNAIRRLPMIDTGVPTIVVAGYPNVGKSSLIRQVSSGEPEVANYPFTTKGIYVGHFERRRVRYQIVDTPGLLDRDMSERNEIERQAVLALKHLAHGIVFLLDPSEYCGYPMKQQLDLLEDVKRMFPERPLVVAENKVDLSRPGKTEGRHQVSTLTGEGIEALMEEAVRLVESARAEKIVR